jgi:hypothetical protein
VNPRAALVGLAAFAAAACVCAATALAARPPVAVTIADSSVSVKPTIVPVGVSVFKVTNRAHAPRAFVIAGHRTAMIAPGATALLSVALTQRRGYTYSSGRSNGFLTVIEPCTHPTASTVNVVFAPVGNSLPPQNAQTPNSTMTFSQTTIPCGKVAFVVKNTSTNSHDLNLDLSLQGGPGRLILGRRLAPGQQTTMTVNFTLRGNVYYYCREPEHSEEGEAGYLAIH